jgi:hypothetical protein
MKKTTLILSSISIAILLSGCGGGGGGGSADTSNGDGDVPPNIPVAVKESTTKNTAAVNPPALPNTQENIPTSNLPN